MTIQELEKSTLVGSFYDVRDQLKSFIYRRADEAFATGDAARDAVCDIRGVEYRIAAVREWIAESMGGFPPSDTPLNAKTVGTIALDGYRIEKVIFESRPNVYVTANLYVPDSVDSPRGAVLFLCGHAEDAKGYGPYQAVCQYLVQTGLIVLAQDPVGQGERFSYYEEALLGKTVEWGCPEHDYAGSQCWPLGDGVARYFVHDAMRGIDYLCSRPEVDPSRIGVTGSSGGGTQTSLMMLCDPRIAAAAPATFIMNLQTCMVTGMAQDAEQIWPGMPARGFDHEDILLCMVPRPVLVLAVSSDFFPVEGARRSVERAKRFWELYGKGGNLQLFEDVSDHRFTTPMARAAAEFFSLHLLGTKPALNDDEIKPLPPSTLWCTRSGQVRGEIADARFVFEENYSRMEQARDMRRGVSDQGRRTQALTWLRDRVFTCRKPCGFNLRTHHKDHVYELAVESCLWWSQEGLFNHAYVFRHHGFIGKEIPVIVAVWDNGTGRLHGHFNWIREQCAAGNAVLVLNVSGVGAVSPNPINEYPLLGFEGTICKLTHDLMWLDDSLAAMRTYDVLRALDMVESCMGVSRNRISLYAHGRQGLYARLAAALDDRGIAIDIEQGMGSYESWVGARHYDEHDILSVVLPGVLKYFDLPDLCRWGKCRQQSGSSGTPG